MDLVINEDAVVIVQFNIIMLQNDLDTTNRIHSTTTIQGLECSPKILTPEAHPTNPRSARISKPNGRTKEAPTEAARQAELQQPRES